MNKLKFVWIMIFAVCVSLSAFAKQIDLRSDRLPTKRSISLPLPVKAFIDEDRKELSLEFTKDLKSIYIEVSDNDGNIVYEDIVDTQKQFHSFVLDDVLSGDYILSISNEDIYVEGLFNL